MASSKVKTALPVPVRVFRRPSEFIAAAIKENWFSGSTDSDTGSTGSAGGVSGGGLIKELIHLIAQYFCVHCMVPPPCLCDSALVLWCDLSLSLSCVMTCGVYARASV